jgi:hypothetical protein
MQAAARLIQLAVNSLKQMLVAPPRDNKNIEFMEEEEGFEPPRGMTRLSVFKTDPFSQTWVFLRISGA